MATAPNPMMAALAPMIMQRLAAASGGAGGASSGPGGPGTGPGASPADATASAAYGRELSSARQADPAALGQKVTAVKQAILELINQTGMSNPGVARALSKTLQGLDAAVKEAASAAATLQVAQPINSSAATGAPGAGGPSPAPVGVPGGGQF
jgi:hypothetical protein